MAKSYIIMLISVLALMTNGCKRMNPVPEAKPGEACGTVSSQFQGPEALDIFKARITKINDIGTIRGRERFILPVGTYNLQLFEQINGISVDRGRNQNTGMNIQLEVEAGKLYRVGAKFLPENRLKSRTNYWQPIVWEVTNSVECANNTVS